MKNEMILKLLEIAANNALITGKVSVWERNGVRVAVYPDGQVDIIQITEE
jgi:hypothetical protein